MERSTNRILVSHVGSLTRPTDLREILVAKYGHKPYDQKALDSRLRSAVAEIVRQQAECGIDFVNDGEFSKLVFNTYVRERISGLEERPAEAGHKFLRIWNRDALEFPEYFAPRETSGQNIMKVTGPLKYTGQAAVKTDIENLKAALKGVNVVDAFMPSVSPGTIEHWLQNEYYKTDEEFLGALADAMHEEYKAIVDSGLILQVDNPDLPVIWQLHADMDIPAYRKFAALRVEAMNHALRGLPIDRLRVHTCWGSYHGPHNCDVPFKDIVDLFLSAKVQCYSIEAANPRHDHEYHVWETTKLPEGKILMPGVVGHSSDFVEHPELVAERLVRYANLVGKENVIAGADCGLDTRVGHPKIAWAKFKSLVEGARIASQRLWKH